MNNNIFDKNIYLNNNKVHFTKSFYNSKFKDGFTMNQHSHRNVEIMYNKSGSCLIFSQNKKYRLESGDYVLINAGVNHKLNVNSHVPAHIVMFEFFF